MRKVFLQLNVVIRNKEIIIKNYWVLVCLLVASCTEPVKNEKKVASAREILKGHMDTINGDAIWICDDPAYEADAFDDSTSEYASVMKMDADRNPLGMGIINRKGEIMVPVIYDGLFTGFSDGYWLVIRDDQFGKDQYGMVNAEGKEIVPPQYDNISQKPVEGLLRVGKDEKYGIINTKGEVIIPVIYGDVMPAKEGMVAFMSEPQRWGYLNVKNEVVIKPEFTFCDAFENGKVILQKPDSEDYIVYKDGRVEKK
jgi:hypothetical protein